MSGAVAPCVYLNKDIESIIPAGNVCTVVVSFHSLRTNTVQSKDHVQPQTRTADDGKHMYLCTYRSRPDIRLPILP